MQIHYNGPWLWYLCNISQKSQVVCRIAQRYQSPSLSIEIRWMRVIFQTVARKSFTLCEYSFNTNSLNASMFSTFFYRCRSVALERVRYKRNSLNASSLNANLTVYLRAGSCKPQFSSWWLRLFSSKMKTSAKTPERPPKGTHYQPLLYLVLVSAPFWDVVVLRRTKWVQIACQEWRVCLKLYPIVFSRMQHFSRCNESTCVHTDSRSARTISTVDAL